MWGIVKIELAQIRANPFRNFDLYPLDQNQIQRLADSIEDLGMFRSIPARQRNGFYEIACGHHLMQAAALQGVSHIDLNIAGYTDAQMVEIMMAENLTQRGH